MKLARLAKVVRSKNAGPFFMTFDIMFEDKDSYERVLDSMVINKKVISELYGVSEEVIDIINYEPAYAITIHKSQGSEWENILILLPQKFNPVLSRELLYTAITRTKKNILIASKNEIIQKMTKTRINRISGL